MKSKASEADCSGLPANSLLACKLDLTHPSVLGVAQKGSEKAQGRKNEWKVLETPPPALHVLYVGVLCVHT